MGVPVAGRRGQPPAVGERGRTHATTPIGAGPPGGGHAAGATDGSAGSPPLSDAPRRAAACAA